MIGICKGPVLREARFIDVNVGVPQSKSGRGDSRMGVRRICSRSALHSRSAHGPTVALKGEGKTMIGDMSLAFGEGPFEEWKLVGKLSGQPRSVEDSSS